MTWSDAALNDALRTCKASQPVIVVDLAASSLRAWLNNAKPCKSLAG